MICKFTQVLAVIALCGCPASVRPEADAEAKRAVLGQVVTHVLQPTLDSFAEEADALAASLANWRNASRQGPAGQERAAAKAAFKAAFLRWQRVEMMAFGPAGQSPAFVLGQGLRDTIYSWPTVNLCRVDTVLADRLYAQPGFFDTALVTTTGLSTVEALLFGEGTDNACPPTAPLNMAGTWAALSAEELAFRRAEYASLAAENVAKQAKVLRDAWADDAGAKFSTAGLTGSGFGTAQAALNEIFAGMFAADRRLKDDRIGAPAGLVPTTCSKPACPELAEARLSKLSREAIVANLDGLRALLRGGFEESEAKQGFNALLEARGAAALASNMDEAVLSARAQVEALPVPVDEGVVSHLEQVQSLYGDVQVLTDFLKGQFVTILSLKVPAEGAGDAD